MSSYFSEVKNLIQLIFEFDVGAMDKVKVAEQLHKNCSFVTTMIFEDEMIYVTVEAAKCQEYTIGYVQQLISETIYGKQ